MKRTMLIPTDFDDYTPRLMDFCAGTRQRGIVRCILVHVVDTSGLEGPVIGQTLEDAKGKLNVLAEPIRQAGIETSIRVVTGNPSYEILSIVRDENVDVIVVGTTAKSKFARLFTGSLSEDIAFGQKAPTLMVRDDLLLNAKDVEESSLEWSRTLVVPVDYSAASARAVLQCTRFEPASVGEVRLLNVIEDDLSNEDMKSVFAEQEFRLSAFCRMLEDICIKAVPVVRQGKVVEEIINEVEDSQATGIVIGVNSKTLLSEFIVGSTTQEIIKHAPVYVMVVP